jgi:hypothetical protein
VSGWWPSERGRDLRPARPLEALPWHREAASGGCRRRSAQAEDPAELQHQQLEAGLELLDKELSLLGNSLADITHAKPLVLTDFGYGGGRPGTNNTKPASTAAQVGSCPECGVLARYTRWAASPRLAPHTAACLFLATPRAPAAPGLPSDPAPGRPPGRANDPWKTFAPEGEDVPTRTAVRQLYGQAGKYLAAGGGPKYRRVQTSSQSCWCTRRACFCS